MGEKANDGILIFDGSGQLVPALNLRNLLFAEDLSEDQLCIGEHIVIKDYILEKIDISNITFKKGISFRNCRLSKISCFYSIFEPNDDGYSFGMFDTESEYIESTTCTFKGEAFLAISNSQVKNIEFSDCSIDSISLRNIVLDIDGKIAFNGKKSEILSICEIKNCTVIKGVIDIRGVINEIKLYCINREYPSASEGGSSMPNLALEFNEADIKTLRFFNSNIYSIRANNTIVENVFQQNTRIEDLRDDALRLFRDAAIRNNDDILILKYTGEVYDRFLQNSSTQAIRKLADKISRNSNVYKKQRRSFVQLLFTSIREAMTLFICSLGSSERIVLWFHKYSNDFNRSWVRGLRFTLSVTLLFYFLLNYCGMEQQFFVIDFRFRGFDQVLLGYISLLDIAGWSNSSDLFKLTSIGKIILFISKLFITYGIWQTIYAFYKYKR